MEGTAEPGWAESYCFTDLRGREGATLAPPGRPSSEWPSERTISGQRHLLDREWSDCASVSTGCPQPGLGWGPRTWWTEGTENEVTYEADGDGQCQVASELGC